MTTTDNGNSAKELLTFGELKVALIVNSKAAAKCSGVWQHTFEYLVSNKKLTCELMMTETGGQATILTRNAVEAGYKVVVAVGGDGTVNECVNGIMTSRINFKLPFLGTIPLGSGCDFARSMGIPLKPLAAAKLLETGSTTRLDVGFVEYSNGSKNDKQQRYFINIADVGAGGVVVREAARSPRFLGKRPNYLWGMLAAVITYHPKTITLIMNGASPMSLRMRNVVVANGKYFGKGFKAAPEARMDDGMLDIVSLGDYTTLKSVWYLPKLRAGKHLLLDKVKHYRTAKVEIHSDEEVFLELDGELVGILPASFEIIPRVLEVISA